MASTDRKYVSALAFAAGVLLIAGYSLQPKRKGNSPSPQIAAQVIQAPRVSRRVQMRELGEFLTEQAAAASEHVLRSNGLSATVWTPNMLLTAGSGAIPIALVAHGSPASDVPVRGDTPPGGWTVMVGRGDGDRLVWTSALTGGALDVECGSFRASDITPGLQLSKEFFGAGVFDTAGMLVGTVANCGGIAKAISTSSAAAILEALSRPEWKLTVELGVDAKPLTEEETKHFGVEQGLLISRVWHGSTGQGAGLQPGDIILPEKGDNTSALRVLRAGRIRAIERDADVKTVAVRAPPAGVELAFLPPTEPLARAGLRPGDRILRVGSRTVAAPAALTRALNAQTPVYVVAQRNETDFGVLVQP